VIQSLFSTDLFRCFSRQGGKEEVPIANKPRRACLYVMIADFYDVERIDMINSFYFDPDRFDSELLFPA
jgi:hypothetical protein